MNQDVIYYPESSIKEAVEKFETPFFIYEEKRLRENAGRFRDTFRKYFPSFQPLFAVKANPNPDVLKIIADEGFLFDASSAGEVWISQKLGIAGMHTGNYLGADELKMAKDAGFTINLDDVSQLDFLKEIGVPEKLSFRINPGMGKGEYESLIMAGPDAKYGIPYEKAADAYKKAQDMGAKHFGIHMMTGSNVLDEGYFPAIVGRLLDTIANIKEKTGIEIEFMNIGGGFGVPYRPEEKSLDLERVASGIREAVDKKCNDLQIREPVLMAEPGRYVCADAGWLVGRVQVIKDSYKKFVGIDAASNDMPRPSIYGAYHHISVLDGGDKQEELVSVVGTICENNDQFGKDRELPACKRGDIVIIHNCGGHARAMGHNYNGKLRHAEYLIEKNGNLKQIRTSETVEDLYRGTNI
ncbi:MAG: diaminopimelate decarboxylase [Candidatus Spechtbacterales bacterium]